MPCKEVEACSFETNTLATKPTRITDLRLTRNGTTSQARGKVLKIAARDAPLIRDGVRWRTKMHTHNMTTKRGTCPN